MIIAVLSLVGLLAGLPIGSKVSANLVPFASGVCGVGDPVAPSSWAAAPRGLLARRARAVALPCTCTCKQCKCPSLALVLVGAASPTCVLVWLPPGDEAAAAAA